MGQLDRGLSGAPCDFYATSLTGAVFAAGSTLANFEVSVPSGGTLSGFCNVCIRTDIASGATTFEGNRLLYMYACNDKGTSPVTDASFIRFEDNGDYPYYAVLEFATKHTAGTLFFLYATDGDVTCMSYLGTCSTQEGFIKVRMGSATRYIALYSTKV
jgi:hypothetical protein